MKTFGRISLLFLLCAICLVGGAYINSIYTKWFYPNRYEKKEFEEYAQMEESNRLTEEVEIEEPEKIAAHSENGEQKADVLDGQIENPLQAAATGGDCTDCDTIFVVMKYDMQTKTTVQEESAIPAKYIGMSREAMQEALAMYVAAPPLSELNQGFVTAELISFSPDRVAVRKSYQKEEETQEFIILAEQNYVTVYRNDTETVYLYTDIRVDELPPEVQQEIIRQKYVDSEEELYNFLESYSS